MGKVKEFYNDEINAHTQESDEDYMYMVWIHKREEYAQYCAEQQKIENDKLINKLKSWLKKKLTQLKSLKYQ